MKNKNSKKNKTNKSTSRKFTKELVSFLHKTDSEGLDYALQNYSNDLAKLNDEFGRLRDDFCAAYEAVEAWLESQTSTLPEGWEGMSDEELFGK
jgi:hypothetical protein